MAVKTSWVDLDPFSGINFNQTYAAAQPIAASATSATGNLEQAAYPGDQLGTMRKGTDGSEWILVKASTTVTQFNVIVWDDSYNANNFTTALALTGFAGSLGVPQFQKDQASGSTVASADPSTNPVFWAAVRGTGMQVNVSGSAGTGVALNNGTAAGLVSVSTTGTAIHGIVLLASAGASGAIECSVLYPHAGAFS